MVGDTIRIDHRYRGPATSGNGGVGAGLAAAHLGGPARVRIRRPLPLDTNLRVRVVGAGIEVEGPDGEVVMQAVPAEVPDGPPLYGAALAALVDEVLARGPVPVPADHPAAACYVCGPRPDGLRVLVRQVPGTEIWATAWTPDASTSRDGARVDHPIVWGVLDCPAAIAVLRGPVQGPAPFFPALTTLTGFVDHSVEVGEAVAVLGWNLPVTGSAPPGRPRDHAGTAVVRRDGEVLARGDAWSARLPSDFGSGRGPG